MLTCQLDPDSRITLCDQLCEAVQKEIREGRIVRGGRLPSKRQLAEHLHISTATVEAAYSRLISEGWCESRPRSGIYAAENLPETSAAAEKTVPVKWDFSMGAADTGSFPYATWARLMREVLSEQDGSLLLSGDGRGSLPLRVELSQLLHRLRGIDALPEQIVLGAGTGVLAADLVSLIGREKLFAVEDPGYTGVRRNLVASGARIIPVPLREGAVDIRELYISGAGAVYVTPARQFPTGAEMNDRSRQALQRWAKETGGVILEDDFDSEFRFSGTAKPPLCAEAGGGQVVYMNTFARTLAPGLRLSFMVLPESLSSKYNTLHTSCTVSGFEQETLKKFIAGGYLERHISRMRVVYRSRIRALEQGVQELGLGETAPCDAGLYLLLRAGGKLPAEKLVSSAEAAGVRLTRMSDYAVGQGAGQEENGRTVLLGFAGMDEEHLREGLKALRDAWL